MSNHETVKRIRDAVKDVFDGWFDPVDVDRSIVHPDDDRGGWSPEAEAIVYFENGLNSGDYDSTGRVIDKWIEVSERLDMFMEPINGAVGAFYKV